MRTVPRGREAGAAGGVGRRLPALLATVLMTAAVAAGCSNESASDPSADAEASATESAGGDSGAEGDAGAESASSETLSADYPKKEVPLVKGDLLLSGTGGDQQTVTLLVTEKPKPALNRAVERLEGRGLAVKQRRDAKGGSVAVLTSRRYRVEVSAIPAGTQTSVTYLVVPKG